MAQLSASGEDVVGRIRLPQFLLLARTLLLPPLGVHARLLTVLAFTCLVAASMPGLSESSVH